MMQNPEARSGKVDAINVLYKSNKITCMAETAIKQSQKTLNWNKL